MQCARLATFVHTTHFRSPENDSGAVASLSNSVKLPLYRVMLWRNNPFHLYTGYVEANITTGQPSQPEKQQSFEHPMWLINSSNKVAADRKSSFSVGFIDNYFDDLAPHFCRYIRSNVRGREVAEEYFAKDPGKGYEQQQSLP